MPRGQEGRPGEGRSKSGGLYLQTRGKPRGFIYLGVWGRDFCCLHHIETSHPNECLPQGQGIEKQGDRNP